MSTRAQWLAANDDFLAGKLAWLRSRMEALAKGPGDPGEAAQAPQEQEPKPAPGRKAPQGKAAHGKAKASEDGDGADLPLDRLARAFGLTDFETNIVFLCTAMEFDTGLAALCARAQHDATRDYPTFALAMELFENPAWEAMAPNRPLRHWPLLTVGHDAPLTGTRLSADERTVNYVKGLDHLDVRLGRLLVHITPPAALPPSESATAEQLAAMVGPGRALHAFALPGPNRSGKELVAAAVADGFRLELFKLDAADLPVGADEVTSAARLWHRESLMSAVALFIDATDVEPAGAQATAVRRFLAQTGGLVFAAVREPWPRLDLAIVNATVTVDKPTAAEQAAAWIAALGQGGAETAETLVNSFDLELADIARAVERAGAHGTERDGTAVPDAGALWEAALEVTRPALDQLAAKVDAKARLADVKLPAAEAAMLREIAGQLRQRRTVYDHYGFGARMNRGMGLGVLFAGESGTGKTMAAEALANELGLMLYKIDLSAVVSKYIGETEKNLRSLFDAAEAGGAMLFFDEADALFGKRSEVKDSHDRYANIEVSYLLQRMEGFNGLAVLASNRKDSLDAAFLRRLRFVVNFPFPGHGERLAMWQEVFPSQTPVGGIDFERLGRLNLTGGSIHNVALNAAFLAANDGGLVTMPLLLAAARSEFRKLERPVNEADFAWRGEADGDGH